MLLGAPTRRQNRALAGFGSQTFEPASSLKLTQLPPKRPLKAKNVRGETKVQVPEQIQRDSEPQDPVVFTGGSVARGLKR